MGLHHSYVDRTYVVHQLCKYVRLILHNYYNRIYEEVAVIPSV